jgi:hypothetical protein
MLPFPTPRLDTETQAAGSILTKQIPGAPLHKLALGEQAFILKDKVEVLRAVDEHPRRQSRHVQGDGLVAKLALAFVEPAEQLPARLQELDTVADQRQGIWGVPQWLTVSCDVL